MQSTRRIVTKLTRSSKRISYGNKRSLSYSAFQFNKSTWDVRGVGVLLAASGIIAYTQWKKGSVAFAESQEEKAAKEVQPTVVTGTHPQGAFVTIRISNKADLKEVAKAAAKLQVIVDELATDSPNSALPSIMAGVGFAPHIILTLFSVVVYRVLVDDTKTSGKRSKGPLPKDMVENHARKGAYGDIPKTGGDILLHVKAETQSLCYEVVRAFVDSMPLDSVDKVEDWYGFQYQEGRDLSGFLDGTENPGDITTRVAAAAITKQQDAAHENGSYAIHQRWVHNLKPFSGLGIDAQEAIIGRTKPDSVELSGDLALVTSHVQRMRVDRKKVPIVRQSMPFGTVGGEHGLLFLAYSNTPAKFDTLLDRMAGSDKSRDGAHNDAIMAFSKCVASQYYYVPSRKELQSLQ